MKRIVLFVDDDPDVLRGLKAALRKEPYDIVTASSAQAGLDVLSRRRVDVVISDERMPGMSGSEFLSKVRQLHPDSVRIMLTGQASLDATIKAINEGEVYRFLTKPCNSADLAVTIRQALQARELARESAKLLRKARRQSTCLSDLEEEYPGITNVRRDSCGALLLDEGEVDIDKLLEEIRDEVQSDPSTD